MKARQACCHCGRLQLECDGAPSKVSMCHCLDCQRRTGSAFSVAVFYERERVRVVQGETAIFQRPAASGFPVKFHFCPACGSNVYWEPERLPHLVGVAIGAFADPSSSAPDQSVWTKDKHAWLSLPAGITTHEQNPR